MADEIVVMERGSGTATKLKPMSFEELGVQELKDLEKWIENNPNIPGEDLLILSSEFDRFDKSKKRLDLLAIDKNKKIVVIELKRDISGSLADLQAIRYAAFCSTMTFKEAVQLRAEYARRGNEEAAEEIRGFIGADEFSELELDNKPRIILAAGAFDDQELTSCVLWLRNFKVDITCVELTPYCFEESGKILLVPKVIIPLPEASGFIVLTENKQAEEAEFSALQQMYRDRNEQLRKYVREGLPEIVPPTAPARNYMQLPTGLGAGVHYEFIFHGRAFNRVLDVAVHFETASKTRNEAFCKYLMEHRGPIEQSIGTPMTFEFDRGNWNSAYVRSSCEPWDEGMAREAARKMIALVNIVQPLLEEFRAAQV